MLYHCSLINHGPSLTVKRMVPFRGEKEPATPRLCCSDCLAGCFAARLFCNSVYVYKIDRKGIKPKDVWDAVITGERWLIPPSVLTFDKIIDRSVVMEIQWYFREYHVKRKRNSTVKSRVYQYLRACEVLGEETDFVRQLKIMYPENPLKWIKDANKRSFVQKRETVR